jgi:O-antigen ligase
MRTIAQIRRYATMFLVFLLPWQARWIARPGMLYGTPLEWLTLSIFATEIIVALIVLLGVFDRGWRERIRERIPRSALAVLGLLLLWALASTLWAHDADLAIQKISMLALLAAAFLVFAGHERPRSLATAFIASIALQAALGSSQTIAGFSPASTWLGVAFHDAVGASSVVESAAGRLLRSYGTLPHPNVLGGYLAVAIILGAAAYLKAATRRGRIAIFAALALMFLALFLTFSRSAWLAATCGLLPLIITASSRRQRTARLLILALIPSLIAVAILWPFVLGRVSGQGRLEARSTAERVASWRDGAAVFLAHPFLGVGAGQLNPDAYGSSAVSTEPAHFVPLEVAAEFGLVGLIALLILAWLMFKQSRRSTVGLGLFLAVLIAACFDHYFWTLWAGNLLLAFAAAMIFTQENRLLFQNSVENSAKT